MLIIQKYKCKWLVWLKQEANEVSNDPIKDSKVNLLEEGGNDTVQTWLILDFDVKFYIVQLYTIEHISISNH